ncbi:alpha/beta fold hydrolase [Roseovarius aestuarii]|uniref:Lipase 3 n=1 Tax=Roseovarius aestuarii TaxID=475083 RepID=A0A1X7BTR7_9RHOB|nr:alpha/beta hydrolase [Roseovarius aestuarii]SMC13012.1 Lipase 3 precursor [Roseovarius aestuarii]
MIWIALALLVALIAAPFLAEARRPKMTQAARASAPGEFASLSRGLTHFRWLGPEDGPVAVCVHGLTTPSFVWTPIAGGLAERGFRVLLYDLYGRGYSDRPRGAQDADFFVAQLEELLQNQKVEGKITLLGYSMGGAITAAFTAHFPDRVRQLVLLAPLGMGHDLGPIARLVINHNRLGTWLMMALYGKSYRQALEGERGLPSAVDGIVDLQMAELDFRGFRPAVLSSTRNIVDEDIEEKHRAICVAGVPVLAIWGREDEVIPIAGLDRLTEWNPDARQEVIDAAAHALAYTHSDQVLNALRDLSG